MTRRTGDGINRPALARRQGGQHGGLGLVHAVVDDGHLIDDIVAGQLHCGAELCPAAGRAGIARQAGGDEAHSADGDGQVHSQRVGHCRLGADDELRPGAVCLGDCAGHCLYADLWAVIADCWHKVVLMDININRTAGANRVASPGHQLQFQYRCLGAEAIMDKASVLIVVDHGDDQGVAAIH